MPMFEAEVLIGKKRVSLFTVHDINIERAHVRAARMIEIGIKPVQGTKEKKKDGKSN